MSLHATVYDLFNLIGAIVDRCKITSAMDLADFLLWGRQYVGSFQGCILWGIIYFTTWRAPSAGASASSRGLAALDPTGLTSGSAQAFLVDLDPMVSGLTSGTVRVRHCRSEALMRVNRS